MEILCLRSMLCVLLFSGACSSEKVAAPIRQDDTTEMVTPGSIRQAPEAVKRLTAEAKGGHIEAMFGLAAHHITAGETVQARYWLGEAVKHGDCHAVYLLIEESYLKVPVEELPHWRSEERRLGCDPDKSYMSENSKP